MIRSGTAAFTYVTPDINWNLNTGSGSRTFTSPDIPIGPGFSTPPTVVVQLGGIDVGNAANLRIQIGATDVENDEFNLVVNTWADSIIYGVWVTWIAYSD